MDELNPNNEKQRSVTFLKDAVINAISVVDRGANGQEFILFKRADVTVDAEGNVGNFVDPTAEEVVKEMPLLKGDLGANGTWKTAFCVVAVPGADEADLQDDAWSEEEIEKAAHGFLKNGPLINYMHEDLAEVGKLVQSAIALDDIKLESGTIKKGSWYIGIEPHEDVKEKIKKGVIRGVSVQGHAKRVPVAKGADIKYADQAAIELEHKIPYGADGDGIVKCQHIVGVAETGIYDEETESALTSYLGKLGMGDAPTFANLKKLFDAFENRKSKDLADEIERATTNLTVNVNKTSSDEDLSKLAELVGQHIADSLTKAATDKAGHSVKKGDVVILKEDGSAAGFVDEVDGDTLTILSVDKKGKEKRKKLNASKVKVLTSSDKVTKGAAGGSMGGHDPRANGKVKFIVRAFGTWAAGMHRVCTARISSEHPELVAGRDVNALCAWLKDQWAGRTDWRTGRRGDLAIAKGDGLFNTLYEVQILKGIGLYSEENINDLFSAMCLDLSIDENELLSKSSDDESYDEYLDSLFGNFDEEVEKNSTEAPVNVEHELPLAVQALALSIEYAHDLEDAEERDEIVKSVVEDFSDWLCEMRDSTLEKHKDDGPCGCKKDHEHSPECKHKENSGTMKDYSSWKGTSVTDKDGNKWLVTGVDGDKLSVVAGDKKAKVSVSDVKQVKAKDAKATEVEKAATVSKLEEARNAMDDLLSFFENREVKKSAEENTDSNVNPSTEDKMENTEAELVKSDAATEEATVDVDGTSKTVSLSDVVDFANDLADDVYRLQERMAVIKNFDAKLEEVTELVKSLDVQAQVEALTAGLEEVKKTLEPSVEAVLKMHERVEALEGVPGQSTAIAVEEAVQEVPVVVEKRDGGGTTPMTGLFQSLI